MSRRRRGGPSASERRRPRLGCKSRSALASARRRRFFGEANCSNLKPNDDGSNSRNQRELCPPCCQLWPSASRIPAWTIVDSQYAQNPAKSCSGTRRRNRRRRPTRGRGDPSLLPAAWRNVAVSRSRSPLCRNARRSPCGKMPVSPDRTERSCRSPASCDEPQWHATSP